MWLAGWAPRWPRRAASKAFEILSRYPVAIAIGSPNPFSISQCRIASHPVRDGSDPTSMAIPEAMPRLAAAEYFPRRVAEAWGAATCGPPVCGSRIPTGYCGPLERTAEPLPIFGNVSYPWPVPSTRSDRFGRPRPRGGRSGEPESRHEHPRRLFGEGVFPRCRGKSGARGGAWIGPPSPNPKPVLAGEEYIETDARHRPIRTLAKRPGR